MSKNLTLTQNQTKQALEVALIADTPCIVTSSAGLGKSSIIRAIAQEYNLKLIDIRLSQISQYDLLGFPKEINGKMTYVPMDSLPLEGEELPYHPDGKTQYDGYLLFLDELNSADKYVQGAAYKLTLDREVGSYKLHERCKVLAAGNRIQDKALVSKLVSPMKSRLTHIEMRLDKKEFLDYVETQVLQQNWNPIIYSFLKFKPDLISNFDPDKEVVTFACPRTWEMLSKQLNAGLGSLSKDIYSVVTTGIVGLEAGTEFNLFLNFMAELPDISEIERDPMTAKLPNEIGAQWAIGSYLYDKVNKNNVNQVVQYIDRIKQADLKTLTFRMMLPNYPNIIQNPTVTKAMASIRSKIQKANQTP